MASPRLAAAVAIVYLSLAVSAARAGNVVYEFNQSEDGWTVTSDGLSQPQLPWTWDDGINGWSAFWGNESSGSGTYLVSPLLCVEPDGESDNAKFVRLEMLHLFNFGTGTNPATLGQAQYRVNFGPWLGIRSDDFDPRNNNPPEHYRPLYAGPPSPFINSTPYPLPTPPGDWPVAAGDGATAGRSLEGIALARRDLNARGRARGAGVEGVRRLAEDACVVGATNVRNCLKKPPSDWRQGQSASRVPAAAETGPRCN